MNARRWIVLLVKPDHKVELVKELPVLTSPGFADLQEIVASIERDNPGKTYTWYASQDPIQAYGTVLNNPVKFCYVIEAL